MIQSDRDSIFQSSKTLCISFFEDFCTAFLIHNETREVRVIYDDFKKIKLAKHACHTCVVFPYTTETEAKNKVKLLQ